MGNTHYDETSPTSLVNTCCLAIGRYSTGKCTQLGTILSIPEASIAQKLLELCIKKSVIIIKAKEIFIDGCYIRIIACGYHLGRKEFLFGYYDGLRLRNVISKFKWFYSLKLWETIKYMSKDNLQRRLVHRDYHVLDKAGCFQKEIKFLFYNVATWLLRYRFQLGLRKSDVLKILKVKKRLQTLQTDFSLMTAGGEAELDKLVA